MNVEEIAIKFHETYEKLAPQFGYETRVDTKKFDKDSPNGKLMIAVIAEVSALICKNLEFQLNEIAYESVVKDIVEKYGNFSNPYIKGKCLAFYLLNHIDYEKYIHDRTYLTNPTEEQG